MRGPKGGPGGGRGNWRGWKRRVCTACQGTIPTPAPPKLPRVPLPGQEAREVLLQSPLCERPPARRITVCPSPCFLFVTWHRFLHVYLASSPPPLGCKLCGVGQGLQLSPRPLLGA